jgi:hypothetical protein
MIVPRTLLKVLSTLPLAYRRQHNRHLPVIAITSSIAKYTTTKMAAQVDNNKDNSDEFGDDSFWEDFDVDAVVAKAGAAGATTTGATTTGATTTGATTTGATTTTVTTALPPAKRAKVSPNPSPKNDSSSSSSAALHDCLERYFGFREFRSGQEEAIQACLNGRDVAIFWATGSGKSLTFTLPPLLLEGQTALVVSPLISLMQDQVHKLNGLSAVVAGTTSTQPKQLATYLGSAQMDPTMEQRALQGEFKLIFVTPEKLQSAGFLDAIATNLKLCLIAIDESHCVR